MVGVTLDLQVGCDDDHLRDRVVQDIGLFFKAYMKMTTIERDRLCEDIRAALPRLYRRHNRISMAIAGLKRIN